MLNWKTKQACYDHLNIHLLFVEYQSPSSEVPWLPAALSSLRIITYQHLHWEAFILHSSRLEENTVIYDGKN
jgi:hypothetical protein